MAGAGKKRLARAKKDNKPSPPDNEQSATPSPPSGQSPNISPPSRLDGNRDPTGPRSRAGSNASQGSQPGNQGQAAVTGGTPLTLNKNLDLGAFATLIEAGFDVKDKLPRRPKVFNKTGRDAKIVLNTFPVLELPTKRVFQYDVSVGNGAEKPVVIRKVWGCPTVQTALSQAGGSWLFDGSKLAWSTANMSSRFSTKVNLDKEYHRTRKVEEGKENSDSYQVTIVKTKEMRFELLRAYLDGTAGWGPEILDSINFFDHLIREAPSKKFIKIKRNFFDQGDRKITLLQGVEAYKGFYASVRPMRKSDTPAEKPEGHLSVNVDVANTAFWTVQPVAVAAKDVCGFNDPMMMQTMFEKDRDGVILKMRYLKKVKVFVKHLEGGAEESKKRPLTIERILRTTPENERFRPEGYTTEITVQRYFRDKYNIRLEWPGLPLVQMTNQRVKMPMELCHILPFQRYNYKLNEKQTAEMIRFAVTLPDVRWGHIQDGLRKLDWPKDPNLLAFGTKISTQPTRVAARILPNPKVMFHQRSQQNPVDPKTFGRWDLRGKTFIEPHSTPLSSWGVCIISHHLARRPATMDQAKAFIQTFMNIFIGHGGQITQKQPIIIEATGHDEAGDAVEKLWNAAGNQAKAPPQLLMFILPDKDLKTYLRIKKSCECRFGVVSQCLQAIHCAKNQAQYCSNLSMKVNAKLGGATAKAVGMKGNANWFTRPTMVLSADVSHPTASEKLFDGELPSVAAITMSWDRNAMRYAAGVQSNGLRTEILMAKNIHSIMTPMVKNWVSSVGSGSSPEHVIYVRDGVSEGQYLQVLNEEVPEIRNVIVNNNPKARPQFTVIVATKRHHIRFFPEQGKGDKNGNPFPGTLVETGSTYPFEYDFYLCAHSAIKGTARPVHYVVLRDDANMGVEQLQNWLYESSYQFVRSTTPVSMFPAAYYADIAAGRAVAHIKEYPKKSVKPSQEQQTPPQSSKVAEEVGELLQFIPGKHGISGRMWYV